MLKRLTNKTRDNRKRVIRERTAAIHRCYYNCKYTACDDPALLYSDMVILKT